MACSASLVILTWAESLGDAQLVVRSSFLSLYRKYFWIVLAERFINGALFCIAAADISGSYLVIYRIYLAQWALYTFFLAIAIVYFGLRMRWRLQKVGSPKAVARVQTHFPIILCIFADASFRISLANFHFLCDYRPQGSLFCISPRLALRASAPPFSASSRLLPKIIQCCGSSSWEHITPILYFYPSGSSLDGHITMSWRELDSKRSQMRPTRKLATIRLLHMMALAIPESSLMSNREFQPLGCLGLKLPVRLLRAHPRAAHPRAKLSFTSC
jgi:hypothetical protein